MAKLKNYYLFVFQAGTNPKDVFVGHSLKRPEAMFELYCTKKVPVPKALRKRGELILRQDLYELYPEITPQDKALFWEKMLAEKLQKQGYNILSKSLRIKSWRGRTPIGRKFRANLNPRSERKIDYRDEEANKEYQGDVFSYGRKKSHEWNDEVATKYQQSLADKIKQKPKEE